MSALVNVEVSPGYTTTASVEDVASARRLRPRVKEVAR